MTSSELRGQCPTGRQPLIHILAAFCVWCGYVLVHQSLLFPESDFNNKIQILVWAIKSAIFGCLPASLFLTALVPPFPSRKTRLIATAGIICGLTCYFGILISISLYFHYFGDLPHPGMLLERWRETLSIRGQILSQLIGWKEITLAVLWGVGSMAIALAPGSRRSLSRVNVLWIVCILLAGNVSFHFYKWIHNDIRDNLRYGYTNVAQSRGIGMAYAVMTYGAIFRKHADSPPVPYPGKINRRVRGTGLIELPNAANIIILQIESLDWSAIGRQVGNRPITPFLNKLKTRSIIFPNFIAQHSGGGTSDSELSVLTSLLPSNEGAGFQTARYDKIISLPQALGTSGYTSAIFHPNIASYFHRDEAFNKLGFDYYFHESYFRGPARGLFAKDKPFLEQSFEKIKTLPRPFFAYLITLQSHGPFGNFTDKVFHDYLTASLPDTVNIVIDYLTVIHEVDAALEYFFDLLENQGLIADSLIVLFADHVSAVLDQRTSYERIPLMLFYSQATPRSIPSPGSHLDIAPTITNLIGLPEPGGWLGSALLPPDPHRVVVLNNPMQIRWEDGRLMTRNSPEDLPFVLYSSYLMGR